MTVFQNDEKAEEAKQRLARSSPADLGPVWKYGFEKCPDPDLALVNLERWLGSTGNPSSYLSLLAQSPLASDFLNLLGASQPSADALIQNPELAGMLLEGERPGQISREAILEDGRALLAAAAGYNHALDRLRYLKQRYLLPVVMNDLAGKWEQEAIWMALSDTAFAIIELTAETVWRECAGPDAARLPVMIVAFGKLGGAELNYSSDVDLVLACEDGLSEAMAKAVSRFCEMLSRALSDRMGRGSLYRVDLRLRPFGAAGSIVVTMRAVEGYYRLHAQAWEVQALLRTTPITGSNDLKARWEQVVLETCYKPKISEIALDEISASRARTEAGADADDIKRGKGGIRDVEFLAQVLQMLHGHDQPSVRARATCDVVRALAVNGILPDATSQALIHGYTFLRKLEHRLQLVGDQQTQTLPKGEPERGRIARLMGYPAWPDLLAEIDRTRAAIAQEYGGLFRGPSVAGIDRLMHRLGPLAAELQAWIGGFPQADAFYESLAENESSLDRVRRILLHAPHLIRSLRSSATLTEDVLSGEIEEDDVRAELPSASSLDQLGAAYLRARTRILARWSLSPHFDLGMALADLWDSLLGNCCRQIEARFSVIALGSYGLRELSLDSDADLVLLVERPEDHARAESQAQDLLSMFDRLRRQEASLHLDLRLRPEGGKGLLARTYDGLKTYELEDMEMWERFALGQCRLVWGSPSALDVVVACAYALPVTPERLRELVAMKNRIEAERVPPQLARRNVKLGYGGLGDIEWFVHLHEMRFPTAAAAGQSASTEQRLRNLARAHLINAIELEELLRARKHLLETRHRLGLLEFDDIPENPNKLNRLASAAGYADGNAFLAYHNEIIEAVRSVYKDGLERLKA